MSLLAQVSSAVDLAFAAADDLVGELWLTRQQQSAFDPVTGQATAVEVEYLFEGVIAAAGTTGAFSTDTGTAGSEVDGTKQEVVLKPAETTPIVGDVLRVGEQRLRVLTVEAVKPDGVNVLLWILEVSV